MKYTIFLTGLIFSFLSSAVADTSDIPKYIEVHQILARGGRPTKDGIKFLAQNSFKTVINLENDKAAVAKDKKWVESEGMKFISAPMEWKYAPSDAKINFILDTLNDEANWPIFIHCKHGEDRTGLILGLYRVSVDQWTPEDAYSEMLDIGFHPTLHALDNYFKDATGY